MITEDQVVALFAKLNPIPSLDDLDAVETFDTESLMSLRDRSSIVSNQKPIEKKVPVSGRRPLVAALVIVALAAVIAVPLVLGRNGEGGVAALPTVPPTTLGFGEQNLEAGTYVLAPPEMAAAGIPSAQFTLNMPDGWSNYQGVGLLKNGGGPPEGMVVAFESVANIHTDGCQWTQLEPPVGPTVDDLATALSDSWGSDATAPIEVMLDGFAGKQMVLTVPGDVNLAHCVARRFRSWENTLGGIRYYQGPGQIEQLWILDVDGVRLVISASYFPDTSPQDRAELQHIIDSIQIEP